MEHIITFHQTVRGYSHIVHDTVGEDNSGSYTNADKDVSIAVVADGHGESACVRSYQGSRFAVESVINCMIEFADLSKQQDEVHNQPPILDQLSIKSRENRAVKQLTDSIFSRWSQQVRDHYSSNPLTEEEYETGGEYAADLSSAERIEHLYGTTFIAGLRIGKTYLLLQQGDGRCVVFYEDGSADMPIPWDDRCYANVTTSVSDPDAASSVRHVVLHDKERQPIACFFGSDGIEDSYPTLNGTYDYYRKLMTEIMELNTVEEIEQHLQKTLPDLSKFGSGDDTSVAGIVDTESILKYRDRFLEEIREHATEDHLEVLRQKQISMQRKDQFLAAKVKEEKQRAETYRKNLRVQSKRQKKAASKKYKRMEEQHESEKQIVLIRTDLADVEARLNQYIEEISSIQKKRETIQENLTILKLNQDLISADQKNLQGLLNQLRKERAEMEVQKEQVTKQYFYKLFPEEKREMEPGNNGLESSSSDDPELRKLVAIDTVLERNKSQEVEASKKLVAILKEESENDSKIKLCMEEDLGLEMLISKAEKEIRRLQAEKENLGKQLQIYEMNVSRCMEEVQKIDNEINQLRKNRKDNEQALTDLADGDTQVAREYNEYHLKYMSILDEIQELEKTKTGG